MIELNNVYAESCFETMDKMIKEEIKVDNIITSPFYNTGRGSKCHVTQKSRDNHEGRYDVHLDNMTDEEYIDFTLKLFDNFDKILNKNGCILYNMNYGSENTTLIWLTLAKILTDSNFTIADDVIWKKGSAMPNNTSPNKLTRIVEHVFVLCRKSEFKTFNANKQVVSVRTTGQKMYNNYFNFIEAKNNDGSSKLNKATYSTDLILKLMNIYVRKGNLVYDPFSGTCTTQNACLIYGCNYLGSELSPAQISEGLNRLNNTRELLKGEEFSTWEEYQEFVRINKLFK